MVVSFEIENRQGIDNVLRIVNQFPGSVQEASDEFGSFLVRSIKTRIGLKKAVYTGSFLHKTRWEKKRDGGQLIVPLHGVYVSEARSHWVRFKKSRTVLRGWAMAKGSPKIQKAAREGRGMFVKPKHIITPAINSAIGNLDLILKRHTNRVLESRGKSK